MKIGYSHQAWIGSECLKFNRIALGVKQTGHAVKFPQLNC
jgi:hypothetical protein